MACSKDSRLTLLQATVPAAMASDGVDVDGLAGVCFTSVLSLGYASLPAHSPSFPQLLLALAMYVHLPMSIAMLAMSMCRAS